MIFIIEKKIKNLIDEDMSRNNLRAIAKKLDIKRGQNKSDTIRNLKECDKKVTLYLGIK